MKLIEIIQLLVIIILSIGIIKWIGNDVLMILKSMFSLLFDIFSVLPTWVKIIVVIAIGLILLASGQNYDR